MVANGGYGRSRWLKGDQGMLRLIVRGGQGWSKMVKNGQGWSKKVKKGGQG